MHMSRVIFYMSHVKILCYYFYCTKSFIVFAVEAASTESFALAYFTVTHVHVPLPDHK